MDRPNNIRKADTKANPPSALIIFTIGFDNSPIIVPNGGTEEIDADIMRWLRERLRVRNERKAA